MNTTTNTLDPTLAQQARRRLAALGYRPVRLVPPREADANIDAKELAEEQAADAERDAERLAKTF